MREQLEQAHQLIARSAGALSLCLTVKSTRRRTMLAVQDNLEQALAIVKELNGDGGK